MGEQCKLGEFKYHYSFKIRDEDLRNEQAESQPNEHRTRRAIPITYYIDEQRRHTIKLQEGCQESISGFHRKLVFNLVSRVPADKKSVAFTARYCYVVFENNCFLFCIDAVVSENEASPIVVPAQFWYEVNERKSNEQSTIAEYLQNLKKVAHSSKHANGLFDDTENWPFSAGFVEDNFEIEVAQGCVQFTGTGILKRHLLGEFAGLAPIPRFPDPSRIPEHGIIVGPLATESAAAGRRHTPSIRSALEELTSILWGDGGLATWIMGQPGTGKEVFSQALHYGAGRAKTIDEKKGFNELDALEKDADLMKLRSGLSIQSVAGVTVEEFQKRLFSVPEKASGNCVADVIDGLNGTIFLDEFDKPKDPFHLYSSLLRVLEAKQFIKQTYPPGGGPVQETPSRLSNVSWIFAGAFTQIDPRQNVPFDLWSRLKGFIHLHNPLEDDPDYGAALFQYSYLKLVTGVLGDKGDLTPLITALRKEPTVRSYREFVACTLLGQVDALGPYKSFAPPRDLREFAAHFQRLLNRKTTFRGDRIDSPRGIFKATEAAFNFLREKVFHGETTPLTTEEIRKVALDEAHKSLRLSRGPM